MEKFVLSFVVLSVLFSCAGVPGKNQVAPSPGEQAELQKEALKEKKEVDMVNSEQPPVKPIMLPEELIGSWGGKLEVGVLQLRIIFHLETSENGELTAKMDSPDQNVTDLPVSGVKITGDEVIFEVTVAAGRYSGIPTAPGVLEGTWHQGGQSFPLNLTLNRTLEAVSYTRPQDPVKPYPYQEAEVTFANPAAGITLAGTLTYPESGEAVAAVVLITGSGAQNRDEELLGHRPFLVLADHLTRAGIAVLRYDDRGIGGSGGDPMTATTLDFAGDVRAALTFLRQQDLVRVTRYGLIGHSEGGLIAPMVAADTTQVDFIVLMAGPGFPGKEILLQQNRAIMLASGADEATVTRINEINRSLYALALQPETEPGRDEQMRQILREAGVVNEADIDGQLATLLNPWFRFFMAFDPVPTLRQVKVPVLALNGSLDLQVLADENLAAIAAALHAGGNTQYETKLFPGLNHLFQTATTGLMKEYNEIEETIAPQVLEYISSWILARK